jgi:hypothetical protein
MKSFSRLIAVALIIGFPIVTETAIANETAGESAVSEGRAAKNKTKRAWRGTKKDVRDATGNSSIKEDVKDGAKNVGDSVEGAAKTTKDKVD